MPKWLACAVLGLMAISSGCISGPASSSAATDDCPALIAQIHRAQSYASSLKKSIAREQRLIARSRSHSDREMHSTALSQDQAELQRVQSRLAKTRNTTLWDTCISKTTRGSKSSTKS